MLGLDETTVHDTEKLVLINDPGLKAALVACASKGALVEEHE